MANPGSVFSAATNDLAASGYSNRCSNNRPRMKSLCAAAEWLEVGNVALPKPGIVCACGDHADTGNNRTKRNVFFIGTLAFEQRRFAIVHHSCAPTCYEHTLRVTGQVPWWLERANSSRFANR